VIMKQLPKNLFDIYALSLPWGHDFGGRPPIQVTPYPRITGTSEIDIPYIWLVALLANDPARADTIVCA